MKIDGNVSNTFSGISQSSGRDPVADGLKKQIREVLKQLQELSADKTIPSEQKSEQQKALTKQLNDLNNQFRQHELDKQQEERKKAAEKLKEHTDSKTENQKTKEQETGFSQDTVQAMAAAETAQKVSYVREGVLMDLTHEAMSLSNAIKREELECAVSPMRDDLNELYGEIGKVTGTIAADLTKAGNRLEGAAQNKEAENTSAAAKEENESEEDKITSDAEPTPDEQSNYI